MYLEEEEFQSYGHPIGGVTFLTETRKRCQNLGKSTMLHVSVRMYIFQVLTFSLVLVKTTAPLDAFDVFARRRRIEAKYSIWQVSILEPMMLSFDLKVRASQCQRKIPYNTLSFRI